MSSTAPPPICFGDLETTGLDPDQHEIWEIGIIRRDPSGRDWEHHWQIRPTEIHLAQSADEKALEIGRYWDRMVVPSDYQYAQIDRDGRPVAMDRKTLARDLTRLLDGAVLVGSNPAFDAAFLRYFLDATPWHYRTIDIATMAAGYLYGQAERMTHRDCDPDWYGKVAKRIGWPWKSYDASEAAGVARPDDAVAHTALGDARWARDLWDHITTADAFYTASDEQLADMVADAMQRRGGAA
jgi:DNA polymerase III epsilon subunit-like protein